MPRTADEVLTHHINAMMSMDFENAPSDYSENLMAITRQFPLNMEKMAKKLHTLFRCAVGEYVVYLAEMKPYSGFACFNFFKDAEAII